MSGMSNLGLRLAASKSSHTTAAIYASTHIKRVLLGVRNLHERRALLYRIEDGLGDFLPPAALKVVAVDFQQGLLERLNDEVRGKFLFRSYFHPLVVCIITSLRTA